ncbi:conserved membrane protein of unknown function [Petrocella atlantisensis]|uniref:DUF4386 domain-containing protein n=1 Tax=Petrocella atlantisensis TaxID=2173034 RepID=A0A3P7NSN3_9FIRM|nr:DUF4386 family protein [Petrocella atlantisensis]VDN46194.1 conserved membrane protein of unknown function [Petrocella atlantisensis]
MENKDFNEKQWKKIYLMGGIAALAAFGVTLFDIIFGTISSSNVTDLPQTAIERFAEFHNNWFMGLYHLDFVNLILSFIMILVYFGLFAVHRKKRAPYASVALIISIVGVIIFVSNNTALSMLDLSNKYFRETDEIQKMYLASAGEALLVRGEHGGFGVFIGFCMSTFSSLCLSLVMLNGGVFGKKTSYIGIIGYSLLLIYVVLVTFVPLVQEFAVIMATPGGILALIWLILVAKTLINMGMSIENG